MTEHIDELAELYVLGSLGDAERERVQDHVAGCAECATRLDEAEHAVAEMAAGQPVFEPSHVLGERLRRAVAPPAPAAHHWWPAALAFAAALAIAFIPAWVAVDRTRLVARAMQQDERALAQIAQAPSFDKAVFMSPGHRPMSAKVLYGPRGDWYYVVVMHPQPGMQVAYMHGSRMEMLGRVSMHGESGTLYLPVRHKMDDLALLQNDAVVGRAHLLY